MIKIRLQGLPDEVEKAKVALKQSFHVLYESGSYSNRNSPYVRLYLEAKVKRSDNQ